jgi:hypothetical protein
MNGRKHIVDWKHTAEQLYARYKRDVENSPAATTEQTVPNAAWVYSD